jgi:hypothetical protein
MGRHQQEKAVRRLGRRIKAAWLAVFGDVRKVMRAEASARQSKEPE